MGEKHQPSGSTAAMFDTDLDREYEAAAALGVGARATYEADLAGAVCDEATRARLSALGRSAEWSA